MDISLPASTQSLPVLTPVELSNRLRIHSKKAGKLHKTTQLLPRKTLHKSQPINCPLGSSTNDCRRQKTGPWACGVCVILRFSCLKHRRVTDRLTDTRLMAAWHSSGNSVGRINEVILRRARLVLGWVTCTGSTPGGGTLFRYVTSHPGRLSLSFFRGR